VRGKGLGAIELASDVLGMFRELAHDTHSLAELATRLDAGVARGLGWREEFVTALLVEIDIEAGRTSILSCGHPPPLLISGLSEDGRACRVSVIDVPLPAPPLGLLTLGELANAGESFDFGPDDQLLLYTDGVTEARDARRAFYPFYERIGPLAAKTASRAGAGCAELLDLVRADMLRHTGAPLADDAALLLVRAPASWPAQGRGRRLDDLPSAGAGTIVG
jgi:serine phosphatase RsbU (regulator of sigma subunit)